MEEWQRGDGRVTGEWKVRVLPAANHQGVAPVRLS